MYLNNLKKLRNENEYTQEYVAKKLDTNRSTYNSWERGIVMLPIDIADKISLLYNVKLSYVLGIKDHSKLDFKIKKMNYDVLLDKLLKLKIEKNHTYKDIGKHLKCTAATCQRYFNGVFKIPMDRLVLLSQLYRIDIDELCGKI